MKISLQGLLKTNNVLFKHIRTLPHGLHWLHAAQLYDVQFLFFCKTLSVSVNFLCQTQMLTQFGVVFSYILQ